jgi:hypothetical protein
MSGTVDSLLKMVFTTDMKPAQGFDHTPEHVGDWNEYQRTDDVQITENLIYLSP